MEWKCVENCNAECCGIVPMSIKKYNIFKRKIKKKIIDNMRLGNNIVLITKDGSCVFLDNNKCSIYDNRPMICKLYGTIEKLQCPYIDICGNKRNDQEIIAAKELIKSHDKDRIDIIMSEKVQK